MIKSPHPLHKAAAPSRRRAFTLVEILVAVSILAVLLTVILVPLRMGFESFTAGKSRSDVQMHAQLTVNQIANDLRKAKFVFPNTYIEGISNNGDVTSPCSTAPYKVGNGAAKYRWAQRPYAITDANTNTGSTSTYSGVCTATISNGTAGMRGWNNVSRIDMLQMRSENNTSLSPDTGQDFIVTYYPRRLDITKPFDVVDNPIVLFRAQIPFRTVDTKGNPDAPFRVGGSLNANIDWNQYPDTFGTCSGDQSDRAFMWLTHNFYGEADLKPLTQDAPGGVAPDTTLVPGAHTQVTPSDMSLVAPAAGSGAKESLVPELSFRQESTNGQRINRVTITMTLAQYDATGTLTSNGQAAGQRVRVSQTVDLPNASCGP